MIITVLISLVAEGVWCIIHSAFGPILLCGWYRPGPRGEIDTVTSFNEEYSRLRHQAVSTIIFGDMNIHQIRWLIYSRENTLESGLLELFAMNHGFKEIMKQPTRGKYLLDFFIRFQWFGRDKNITKCFGPFVHPNEYWHTSRSVYYGVTRCVEFWCSKLEDVLPGACINGLAPDGCYGCE